MSTEVVLCLSNHCVGGRYIFSFVIGVQIKTYTQGAILKEMYRRRLLSEPKAGLDDEILNFSLTPIMEWDFGSLGKG